MHCVRSLMSHIIAPMNSSSHPTPQVMGIWPKYADGTDINAVDVCNDLGIVATADDSGYLNILNFPSVVQAAPRRTYGGHSSFVQNVRFLPAPASGADQRSVSVQPYLRPLCVCLV